MKLSIHQPSDELKTIVKQYIFIESLEGQESLWVLPNLGNYILFNPGMDAVLQEYNSNKIRHVLPKDFCLGIKATEIVRLIVQEKDDTRFPMLGVELHPTGYHRLFHKDTFELRKEHMLLSECIPKNQDLFSKLYNLDTVGEKIAYIENGLLRLKEEASATTEIVDKLNLICNYIHKNINSVNVNDILREFSYSRTSLTRDFKKVIGYTPKEFIQTLRFYMVAQALKDNGYDYKSLGYDFFDQSHMNRTFKKFVNIVPSKFKSYIEENKIEIYQDKTSK